MLLGIKAMTNPDSILQTRDITLPTKVYLIKAMVFPAVMYEYESWTIKKAESWRIDAFEMWCWKRSLRAPWIARRSNQSVLKEISPEYSLEGLMLKLKLQYFGHLMQRTNSLAKTLMLERLKVGREGDNRGWDGWMTSLTRWTGREFEQALGVGDGQGGLAVHGVAKSQTRLSDWSRLSDWTQLNWVFHYIHVPHLLY